MSFLKSIPDTRERHGIRIPICYLLLVTLLGILSKFESLRAMWIFARRHYAVLRELLGIELKNLPRISFSLLLPPGRSGVHLRVHSRL